MVSKVKASDFVKTAKVVFWDFDGVIKESVDVKTKAFQKLFVEYGTEVTEKIRLHHEANGGMSRFEKFPIYLDFANVEVTKEKINRLCEKFSDLVLDGVINSPWVPGAEIFIRTNPNQQIFIVVSATPTEELLEIIDRLNLRSSFESILGAPTSKIEAIKACLHRLSISACDAVMIGDASADLDAASANKVPFILRRHSSNTKLVESFSGITINDFEGL
jgi:phosphoglycolate phosphatase-like HAD superfamily hydrolase